MKKLILVLALFALSACSTLKTNSDYNPSFDFSQVKTYAWVQKKVGDSAYHLDGLMDQRVRMAIAQQLRLKGLTLTNANDADVLINYLTKVNKRFNVNTFNTYYGYHPYFGPGWGGMAGGQTTVREYNVGTLIVDMINNQTHQLIWRGSAEDTIRQETSPQARTEAVNKSVAALFKAYPPK